MPGPNGSSGRRANLPPSNPMRTDAACCQHREAGLMRCRNRWRFRTHRDRIRDGQYRDDSQGTVSLGVFRMTVGASVTLNLGVIKITLTQDELASLRKRFNRSPLYNGPCMILNRDTGLALDAGPNAKSGDHNVLWKPHGAPWQQWRLRGVGGGEIEIRSESSGLRLTTMATPSDWSDVWLDRKQENDWSTRWRLKSTDDGVAFVIRNAASRYALDAARLS
jgi:hypothetical protein